MKTKILLVGPLLTRSGYGEQTRFALRALKSREDLFDIYIQPLSWGQTSWIPKYNEEKVWIDQTIGKTIGYLQQGGRFDVSLQVTIPNEWKKIAPINIGYTAGIESTKVAHQWIEAVNGMDKVIVVSEHSKNVFETTSYSGINESTGESVNLSTTTEISSVNYPVKFYDTLPELELDLKHDTNFLSVAQWGIRKNIPNMLGWFLEEFKDEEVGFVLKTNFAKNSLIDRELCEGNIKNIVSRYGDSLKCKVYLLHGDMTDEEMHALYRHKKISAFVGIPHGEGFGLPIFEAAYSGLPVVCTGWSGQLDFLVDENNNDRFYNVAYDINQIQKDAAWDGVLISESKWAYAREDSYRNKLRECYNDLLSGDELDSVKYSCELHERFAAEKMYDEFIEALSLNIDTEWAETLSQIEIL
tara:strand:- start:447 stop:1685 length:1239 start_codon:yes stop_codon:yes gene_type:complete